MVIIANRDSSMRSAVIRYKFEMYIRDSKKFPIARVFEWNTDNDDSGSDWTGGGESDARRKHDISALN